MDLYLEGTSAEATLERPNHEPPLSNEYDSASLQLLVERALFRKPGRGVGMNLKRIEVVRKYL
jgi:hypothetical protein